MSERLSPLTAVSTPVALRLLDSLPVGMSVDLAVWKGERPPSDKAATKSYGELYGLYIERDDPVPPTEAIVRYVEMLLARWPDWAGLDEDAVAASPWADSPLINDASGPFFYFAMVNNAAAPDAWRYAVETAEEQGLVCFDPQSERLARPTY
jgi:hypothetical protein